MASLVQILANSLDAQAIQQISSQLGVENKTAQQAIGLAIPMLLGALSKNTSDSAGAESLNNALHQHSGNVLNNVADSLSNEATMQDGAAILGHILGGRETNVATGLGRMSGLDADTADQVLIMAAPLVMGVLGQAQDNDGLDADGIANLLHGEQEEATAAPGLAQFLDLDQDGDATDDVISLGTKLLGGFLGAKR